MPIYTETLQRMVTRKSFDLIFENLGNDINGTITRSAKNTSITIYSGSQPTAQVIEADWTSYNQSANICLAHYSSGPDWLWNDLTRTYYFTNTSNTITTNALRSGTAAWAIIWDGNSVNINTEILPNAGRFIVVPLSLTNSNGIIRYTNLTTTSGQAFLPYDAGLSITE